MSEKLRVMKFGGSSLGSPERIVGVIDLTLAERERSSVALVVSAMGDLTDRLLAAVALAAEGQFAAAESEVDRITDYVSRNALLALAAIEARRGSREPRPELLVKVRELLQPLRRLLYGVSLLREKTAQTVDLVLSFGELSSAAVVAELLNAAGSQAIALDSRDWTVTDTAFGNAGVLWTETAQRVADLRPSWGDAIVVSTGFLGRAVDGRSTTLGRNGSDYTATLFARALHADEVVRWTDVSGVMTADPDLVVDAYPIARLSYMEALELANFGAKVFHSRTMIPLIESGIPMRIGNTMRPEDPGTRIDRVGSGDVESPTSVTSLERLALLGVEWRSVSLGDQAHLGDRVLRALDQADITVWMANQAAHGQAVAVVVPQAQAAAARAAIEEAVHIERLRGELEPIATIAPVTLISLVAEAMGQLANVAGRFFGALGAVGVNVRAIAQGASSRSIACVVDAADTAVAVRTVHSAFNFAHDEVNVLLYGIGTVGASLLDQIRAQSKGLEREHRLRVRVVGVATSRWSLFDPDGLPLDYGVEPVISPEGPAERLSDAVLLERLRRLPNPVLVDCTAADGMEHVYVAAFEAGVHVVAANKKPLATPMPVRRALFAAAQRGHRAYRYETTVGASLPVIDTLQNIVRTGDHVVRVEGSFSGTLGYLCNALMAGQRLSAAVREARALGYTEPNPADDLGGTDVARKALILAREMGYALDLDDVNVAPLVSADVLSAPDGESLMRALESIDADFEGRVARCRAEGRVLRYLAQIAPDARLASGARVEVGPVEVPVDHPATRLRGTEAFVAFTTERYSEYPLLVQGAGAGGAVTAAGVLADLLQIPSRLRRR